MNDRVYREITKRKLEWTTKNEIKVMLGFHSNDMSTLARPLTVSPVHGGNAAGGHPSATAWVISSNGSPPRGQIYVCNGGAGYILPYGSKRMRRLDYEFVIRILEFTQKTEEALVIRDDDDNHLA